MIECIWPMAPGRNSFRDLIDNCAHKLKKVPGFCNVCSSLTTFDTSQRNYREYVVCSRCGSVNRQRQITAVLLSEIFRFKKNILVSPINFNGPASRRLETNFIVPNLASISLLPEQLKIWNAETTRALHFSLINRLKENYVCSEYIDSSMQSGELHEGLMHVDMQKTHFDDSSLDYILSSDVLEHIPDPIKALKESFRILKPGGAHIFTIPFYHHRFTIERRSKIAEDESIIHLKKPWFHDDPVRPSEGALVFNIFAPELLCDIERIGFEARLLLIHSPIHGIYGNNGIVIVARKSVPPDHARDWIFD